MRRAGALLWLGMVVLAVGYLGFRFIVGINFESNLLALLPRSERDTAAQNVEDRVTANLSRRVLVMVGHENPDVADQAAAALSRLLVQSGLVVAASQDSSTSSDQLARVYFRDRAFLLSEDDRKRLLVGQAPALVNRALSILYGPAGIASGRLVSHDPFLLFPSFVASLPIGQSRMTLTHGKLSVRDHGQTFFLLSFTLAADPYSMHVQDKLVSVVAKVERRLNGSYPGLSILWLGAVFYAQASTAQAMGDTSIIGLASMLGTLGMILAVFRRSRPILLGFLSIGIGVIFAIVGTLIIFGGLHVIALLFGVSLIGISIDYCLQYFCEYFDIGAVNPDSRLARVLPGVLIGVSTTIIGYMSLLLAPFPGLRQVAAFSVIGLSASLATVVLWFPLLDVRQAPKPATSLLKLAGLHWAFWEERRFRGARWSLIGFSALIGIVGTMFLRMDDDVRHLQSLSPTLREQENRIRDLTGLGGEGQYLLVKATDEQAVLRKEELLLPLLRQAQRQGVLKGYRAIAQFIPSVERQHDNWKLVQNRLITPYLRSYLDRFGEHNGVDYGPPSNAITPSTLLRSGPLAILSLLDTTGPQGPTHIVMLNGVLDPAALGRAMQEVPGVELVSPAADWSRLFGVYRRYALGLLALSAVLMYPLLAWRYGWLAGIRVMLPSIAAATLAPAVIALFGMPLSFFNTMALVLVLSIGVDYSVFCRETSGERKPVTMLAVALAALSSILTFGLLALSHVAAVRAFGITMLAGILLSFLLAPAAGESRLTGSTR